MKTFQIKNRNGHWYEGQMIVNYNLLNVLRVLIIVALLAAVITFIYWLFQGICRLFDSLTPVFRWIGDNWWWLLLSLIGVLGLIWAWLKGLFRNLLHRRPKMNRPQRESKRNRGWLILLLLLLGSLLIMRNCGSEEKIDMPKQTTAEVYRKSFDNVIIGRAYLDGVQKEITDGWPVALVGLKFINDKSAKEYNFQGKTYDEAVDIVAEDWRPLVTEKLNPNIELSEQQMAVLTLAAMRMGKNGFPRSTFLKTVNAGKLDEAGKFLRLELANGEIRKTKDEPKQYFYMLQVLWDNELSFDELLDLPMFSYRAVPLQKMFDKQGNRLWSPEIKKVLEKGFAPTPRMALELN